MLRVPYIANRPGAYLLFFVLSFPHFGFASGTAAEYRVTPWAGVDTQVGYRNAMSQSHFRQHLAGIYYSYGITLYPGTIYRDMRDWYKKKY